MFAYCNNAPVMAIDTAAFSSASAISVLQESAGWLPTADGPYPIGDGVYAFLYIVAFFVDVVCSKRDVPTPDVEYPGDDPTKAPDGYEWTGPDEQGGQRGGYKNSDPEKKDSWHPDLNNRKEGPHWDYNDGNGNKWRVYPNGEIILDGVKYVGICVQTISKSTNGRRTTTNKRLVKSKYARTY